MGLLDNLFSKKNAKKVLDGAVNDAAEKLFRSLGINNGDSKPIDHREYRDSASEPKVYAPRTDLNTLIPEICARNYPGLTAERRVSAAALGLSSLPCKPYDFCLTENGRVKAVIMLTEHNRDRNALFLNAKQAALSNGISFINFYTHMGNEPAYVEQRLASFLG